MLKTTEFYTLQEYILWYVKYISKNMKGNKQ